jgi:2-alkenal reductase
MPSAAGDLQGQLEQIYQEVSPSVVNIQVSTGRLFTPTLRGPNAPRIPGIPRLPTPGAPTGAQGSGFVWDTQGHIVTNNHVIDGASKIAVIFSDGTDVTATLVGRDVDSDLAVIQVDPSGLNLHPVALGDSTKLQVGQFVLAIGNPFGLQGTMTFGIISALGRSLPAGGNLQPTQPTFTIPNIIQTDAPINPGNSGGVLLDLEGNVIGVPTAIESSGQSSSGVGFAIPAAIVQTVVQSLISTGTVQHPYLGIEGTTLTPDLAQAMGLALTQRGALVISVTPGGPAAKAGVLPSTRQVIIDGQQASVGGDLILGIDQQPVKTFDELVSYLAFDTKVGQTVTLAILRNGKESTVQVTLGNRPAIPVPTPVPPVLQITPPVMPRATPQLPGRGAWLGVTIINLTPEIAQAMNLQSNTVGVLVEDVSSGSPAAEAGLNASSTPFTTSEGQVINIGGDVIIALNGSAIRTDFALVAAISRLSPGQKVTLTVLRDGTPTEVPVTLGTRP